MMNQELETTRHELFHRLKQEFKNQLWDALGDAEYTMFYDRISDILEDGMNESFKLGEGI